jgi:hypothetical protein
MAIEMFIFIVERLLSQMQKICRSVFVIVFIGQLGSCELAIIGFS